MAGCPCDEQRRRLLGALSSCCRSVVRRTRHRAPYQRANVACGSLESPKTPLTTTSGLRVLRSIAALLNVAVFEHSTGLELSYPSRRPPTPYMAKVCVLHVQYREGYHVMAHSMHLVHLDDKRSVSHNSLASSRNPTSPTVTRKIKGP